MKQGDEYVPHAVEYSHSAKQWLIAEVEQDWDDESIVAAFNAKWGSALSEEQVRIGIRYTRDIISRRPKYCQACGQQVPKP